MARECEYHRGQLNSTQTQSIDGNPNSPTVSGAGVLRQVSVTFEGTTHFGGKQVRSSRLGIDFDGTTSWCPRIHEVNKAHVPDNYGTTCINVTSFNASDQLYGYYIVFDSDFEDGINIMVENGDSNPTDYECVVLYDR